MKWDAIAGRARWWWVEVEGGEELGEGVDLLVVDVHRGTGNVHPRIVVVHGWCDVGVHDGWLHCQRTDIGDLDIFKDGNLSDKEGREVKLVWIPQLIYLFSFLLRVYCLQKASWTTIARRTCMPLRLLFLLKGSVVRSTRSGDLPDSMVFY